MVVLLLGVVVTVEPGGRTPGAFPPGTAGAVPAPGVTTDHFGDYDERGEGKEGSEREARSATRQVNAIRSHQRHPHHQQRAIRGVSAAWPEGVSWGGSAWRRE